MFSICKQVTRLCDLSSDANTVTSVSWSERGNQVAVGTHHGYVTVWDVAANKQVIYKKTSPRKKNHYLLTTLASSSSLNIIEKWIFLRFIGLPVLYMYVMVMMWSRICTHYYVLYEKKNHHCWLYWFKIFICVLKWCEEIYSQELYLNGFVFSRQI